MTSGRENLQGQTVIFLHIPKAGGNTLHRIVQKQYDRDLTYSIVGNRLHESVRELKELDEPSRARIALLKGHMPFGLHKFLPQPSTYITMLREPVDRVISHYYFVVRKTGHYAHDVVIKEKMDLKEYVNSGIVRETDNGQTRLLAGVGGAVGFGQCTSVMLETAKENLRRFFSVVGLMERYDETLILLKRTFGWRMPFYIRRNVTKGRPLREHLPNDTLEVIRQRNELDIELYRYARALMREQVARQSGTFHRDLQVFRILNSMYRPYGRLRALARVGYHGVRSR